MQWQAVGPLVCGPIDAVVLYHLLPARNFLVQRLIYAPTRACVGLPNNRALATLCVVPGRGGRPEDSGVMAAPPVWRILLSLAEHVPFPLLCALAYIRQQQGM